MKTPNRPHRNRLSAGSKLLYFRLVLIAGALAYLLFGIIYGIYIPGEVPMSFSHRLGVSGFFLIILATTYLSERARKRIELLIYVAISGALSHLVYFAHVSGYKLNYALSLLVVIILVNFLFRGKIKLRWFNVTINLAVAGSIYLGSGLSFSNIIYIAVLVTVSALSYILSRSKYLAQEEYEQLFEDSPIGLVRCNSEGRILDYNREMLRLAGNPAEKKLETLNIFNFLEIDAKDLNPGESVEKLIEFPWGNKVWIDYSIELIPREAKKPRDIIIACRDITDRKRAEDKIEYITYHDNLTDLFNRSYFQDWKKTLGEAQCPLTVIFIDIDNLKLVNDAFGHQIGDKKLVKSAKIVKFSCREDDLVFRWGGDEIVVMLPSTTEEEGELVIERIRDNCANSKFEPVDISLSAGRATIQKFQKERELDRVLKEAETRMYKDKMEGREEITNKILSSITNELEERSEPVMKHSRRVEELSVKLGEEIGLKENDLERLAKAARYHDIGKISLEQEFRNKKYSELTDKEEEELATHAETGYQILKELPDMTDVARIVLHHHERWDGTGYPRGIKEENIPYLSRILSVANAYEYLTGEHYHPSRRLSRDEAICELESSAGNRYSPEIVKKFINKIA